MKKIIQKLILRSIELLVLPFFLVIFLVICIFKNLKLVRQQPKLIWGTVPIINYKYFTNALKNIGYDTETLMEEYFHINKREDFDMYYEDFVPIFKKNIIGKLFRKTITPYIIFCYAITKYDIFHHSFQGGFLGKTLLWRWESFFLHINRCKVIIISHGGDVYRYSQMLNPSLQHSLIYHYPEEAYNEDIISKKVAYWTKNADIIIAGFQLDGLGRWDVLPFHPFVFDTSMIPIRSNFSLNDGLNGIVKIVHAPNHRIIKGTEYIIQAIEDLKQEGLQLELILLENKKNDEVLKILTEESDISIDQLLMAYGMFSAESMASGLPVITNLDNEEYTKIFRRFSFLNECPMFSATPETIIDQLRILITNPSLRKELGIAGRQYVEKYHSLTTCAYMFGKIYDKIWHHKEVDLLNLFHPLLGEYNRMTPKVIHPLVENKLKKTE